MSGNAGNLRGGRAARILVVDDHPIVRQGYSRLISSQPNLAVCGEADNAPEALRQVAAMRPDLVVIDVSLREGNGIELARAIRTLDGTIKMLISSMYDESLFAERALRAGAAGYINKQEAAEQLIAAIQEVLDGHVYLSQRMKERLLQRSLGSPVSLHQAITETLSDRELEVFMLIGRGCATRQIAGRLELSPKTVETYRENIKQKLSLRNSTELTRHAVQWVLENA